MIATLALLAAVQTAPTDTLYLADFQRAAVAAEAIRGQTDLERRGAALRMENIRADWYPRLRVLGDATHQSETVTLPFDIPGFDFPDLPKDRFNASLRADQTLYDGGGIGARLAVERARLSETEAGIEARLRPLWAEVNQAYFGALLAQSQVENASLLIQQLEARLEEARLGVREGVALPGDTAALAAEQLRAMQGLEEATARRRAALAVLGDLTGDALPEDAVLATPDLADRVATRRAAIEAAIQASPEYLRLEATRERIARQAEAIGVEARPRVEAFGQAGFGRPGPYQLFDDGINDFWQAGVQLQWQPWAWGTRQRERRLLEVQADIVSTEQASLMARVARQTETAVAEISRLEEALATDATIIELREQVEAQARLQFDERAITVAAYVDAALDVIEARLARERHTIQLQQNYAEYLRILGVPLWEDR